MEVRILSAAYIGNAQVAIDLRHATETLRRGEDFLNIFINIFISPPCLRVSAEKGHAGKFGA